MTNQKRKLIKEFIEDFNDMLDGAFFALAEERGIDQDDWIEYYEETYEQKTHSRFKNSILVCRK